MSRTHSILPATLVASLVAVLAGLCSPTASAAFPGDDGIVAVLKAGDIYLKTVGGGEERLTATGNNGRPHWSPDAQAVAFTRAGKIVVLDVDHLSESTVPGITDAVDIGWSGDGDQFILNRHIAGRRSAVWTVDVDGENLTRVVHPGPCMTHGFGTPAWSPDGKFIALNFVRDRTTPECGALRFGTRVISLESGKHQFIPYVEGHQPSFSSDSSAVIVGVDYQYETSLVRLDLATGKVTALVHYECQTSYTCLGWNDFGQATPGGGFAYIVESFGQEEPYSNDTCFVNGAVDDCFHDPDFGIVGDESGYPWGVVSSFDVQPVTSTP